MIDVIFIIDSGIKTPSYEVLSANMLVGKVKYIRNILKHISESWKLNGCTIMSDGWADKIRESY